MGIYGHLVRSLENGTNPPGGGSSHIATVNATPHPQKQNLKKKPNIKHLCVILHQ